MQLIIYRVEVTRAVEPHGLIRTLGRVHLVITGIKKRFDLNAVVEEKVR
jgi:hypothetical protein